MITHDPRWSLPRGNTLVPLRWQATEAMAMVTHFDYSIARVRWTPCCSDTLGLWPSYADSIGGLLTALVEPDALLPASAAGSREVPPLSHKW